MISPDLRILIADDYAVVRKGLIRLLRLEHATAVFGEAASGDVAITMTLGADWDVVILDLSMPGANGIEVLQVVKPARPNLPIVILSMHSDGHFVKAALLAGASGYVTKQAAPEELLGAIRAVLAGASYVSADVAQQVSSSQ